MNTQLIVIKDIVKSGNWIQVSDGTKVYEQIFLALRAGKNVDLSFSGRIFVITAFLNAAIGKLYDGQLNENDLARLTYVNAEESDLNKVKRVIANAKLYYKNNPILRDSLLESEIEV